MKWIEYLKPNSKSELRVFFCHYAGGYASCYYPWLKFFAKNVEIETIQLPSQGLPYNETPLNSMEDVIENILKEFRFWSDKPFLLFGHSLKALISFEISRQLIALSVFPKHSIVSGCKLPHLPMRRKSISTLPDNEFISELLNYDETSKKLLEHKELIEFFY